MDEFSSLAQGVFKRPAHKKVKAKTQENIQFLWDKKSQAFGPPELQNESYDMRKKFYEEHVKCLKKIMENVDEMWRVKLVDEIGAYVQKSFESIRMYQGAVTPIGFVVSGLSERENASLMIDIKDQVGNHSKYVAQISSRLCTTVKTAFQLIADQLMCSGENGYDDVMDIDEDDEDDDGEEETERNNRRFKKPKVNASDLKKWYKDKKGASPIILIIEDIDLISTSMVQELMLTLCSLKLPFLVIAGILSCCETFESLIPKRCPTTFVYQTFEVPEAKQRFDAFADQIVFCKDTPFRFSGPVLKYLKKLFLHHGCSFSKLEKTVKLLLLEHFRLPESILCTSLEYMDDMLEKQEIDEAMLLTSISGGQTGKGTAIRMRVKKGDLVNGEYSSTIISNTAKISNTGEVRAQVAKFGGLSFGWMAFLKFLIALSSEYPGLPLCMRDLVSFYNLCWNGEIFDKDPDDDKNSTFLEKLISLIGLAAPQEFARHVERALKVLEEFVEGQDERSEQADLPKFIHDLKASLNNLKTYEEGKEPTNGFNRNGNLKKVKTQAEFIQIMKAKAMGDTGRQDIQKRILVRLRKSAEVFLASFADHALKKAFIFDDLSYVESMISPNLHKHLHAGILEPSRFLECDGCTKGDCTPSDISIVYSLVLEQQQRNVNLNLIYDSFVSRITPLPAFEETPKKKRKESKSHKFSPMFLLRFSHSIDELQHQGLVRKVNSKARPDELVKLAFGF